MNSKRIQIMAELVSTNHKVIDIGTDHAYLPIYLVQKRAFTDVTAADISAKVLEQAQKNIAKFNLTDKIKIIVSDGFKNTSVKYETAVIAGLGFNTIAKIINEAILLPEELIIESNNHIEQLRKFMMQKGYQIVKEVVVYEKGKYYVILKYKKGPEKLTWEEINFGKNKDKSFLTFLYQKKLSEYNHNHLPEYEEYLQKLNTFIEKIPD